MGLWSSISRFFSRTHSVKNKKKHKLKCNDKQDTEKKDTKKKDYDKCTKGSRKHEDIPKKKRERIPPDIRDNVWKKYHGDKITGICYCCGISIERYHGGWHCSHVKADVKGGPTVIENLRTCCKHCNLSMGNQNLYAYIRDKKLQGPGSKNIPSYLKKHPSQIKDRRTNNWGK